MNETIITKNNKPGNIGMTAKNRDVLVGYLRKVKMDIEKFKTNNDNFEYLSIKLDCGCEVEYHKEKDIPYSTSNCPCGNSFIEYTGGSLKK